MSDKEEIDRVMKDLNELFIAKQYSNGAVLNALSTMSTHLAVLFGLTKEIYLKDIELMFDERKQRIEGTNELPH